MEQTYDNGPEQLSVCVRSQVAERLGNRASNLKVAGSIPGRAVTLCPWAKHFTLRGMSLYLL